MTDPRKVPKDQDEFEAAMPGEYDVLIDGETGDVYPYESVDPIEKP